CDSVELDNEIRTLIGKSSASKKLEFSSYALKSSEEEEDATSCQLAELLWQPLACFHKRSAARGDGAEVDLEMAEEEVVAGRQQLQ
ncbi:UNVERIFIED_CONTAM: hypothetical protein K2H54_038361, partial [Gekko kuhli]